MPLVLYIIDSEIRKRIKCCKSEDQPRQSPNINSVPKNVIQTSVFSVLKYISVSNLLQSVASKWINTCRPVFFTIGKKLLCWSDMPPQKFRFKWIVKARFLMDILTIMVSKRIRPADYFQHAQLNFETYSLELPEPSKNKSRIVNYTHCTKFETIRNNLALKWISRMSIDGGVVSTICLWKIV